MSFGIQIPANDDPYAGNDNTVHQSMYVQIVRAKRHVAEGRTYAPCYWPFDIVSGGIPPDVPPEEMQFWADRAGHQSLTAFEIGFEYCSWTRSYHRVPKIRIPERHGPTNPPVLVAFEAPKYNVALRGMSKAWALWTGHWNCSQCFDCGPQVCKACRRVQSTSQLPGLEFDPLTETIIASPPCLGIPAKSVRFA